jgi:hypothetical protein
MVAFSQHSAAAGSGNAELRGINKETELAVSSGFHDLHESVTQGVPFKDGCTCVSTQCDNSWENRDYCSMTTGISGAVSFRRRRESRIRH